jgi:hypothetical protein
MKKSKRHAISSLQNGQELDMNEYIWNMMFMAIVPHSITLGKKEGVMKYTRRSSPMNMVEVSFETREKRSMRRTQHNTEMSICSDEQ